MGSRAGVASGPTPRPQVPSEDPLREGTLTPVPECRWVFATPPCKRPRKRWPGPRAGRHWAFHVTSWTPSPSLSPASRAQGLEPDTGCQIQTETRPRHSPPPHVRPGSTVSPAPTSPCCSCFVTPCRALGSDSVCHPVPVPLRLRGSARTRGKATRAPGRGSPSVSHVRALSCFEFIHSARMAGLSPLGARAPWEPPSDSHRTRRGPRRWQRSPLGADQPST